MKSIQVDKEIVDHLKSRISNSHDTAADVLRRELHLPHAQIALEIDDETYRLIAAKRANGESVSDVLRRELHLAQTPPREHSTSPLSDAPHAPPHAEPETLVFKIAQGTGSSSWNSRDTTIVARKGDTLRVINDDTVPHRLHSTGRPFIGASENMMPGQSVDFLLTTTFDPVQESPLTDHIHGPNAHFWLRVIDDS